MSVRERGKTHAYGERKEGGLREGGKEGKEGRRRRRGGAAKGNVSV